MFGHFNSHRNSTYTQVPSGCYALVGKSGKGGKFHLHPDGTKSIVWPPGLHYPHPPSVKVSHLVTKHTIVVHLPAVEQCRTKDDVVVDITTTIAIRIMGDADLGEDPDLVRKFVHELNPRGLDEQLRIAHAEALVRLVRRTEHADIYGMRCCGGGGGNNPKRTTQPPRVVAGASLGAIQRVVEEEGKQSDMASSSEGLGSWVAAQRREYKLLMEGKPSRLTKERIRRLEGIGFEWVEEQGQDGASSHCPTFSDRLKQQLNGLFM